MQNSALLWMLFTTVKMCLCGYGKSVCYQVLPFIMDYKHGVVEMQRHSLVLIVSPLVAQSITLIHKHHTIYPAYLYVSFVLLHNNFHFNYAHAQAVCTRPSPPPILVGMGTKLVQCIAQKVITYFCNVTQ